MRFSQKMYRRLQNPAPQLQNSKMETFTSAHFKLYNFKIKKFKFKITHLNTLEFAALKIRKSNKKFHFKLEACTINHFPKSIKNGIKIFRNLKLDSNLLSYFKCQLKYILRYLFDQYIPSLKQLYKLMTSSLIKIINHQYLQENPQHAMFF